MKYIVYNSITPIGEDVAKQRYIKILYQRKTFSDGEFYVRIENIDKIKDNSKVFILVQEKSWPEFNPNRIFVESILLSRRVKELTNKVYLILPYFPYSRQDKEFLKGEPISFKYFLEVLEAIGVKKVITITLHAKRDKTKLNFNNLTLVNIKVPKSVIDFIKENFQDLDLILGPDFGSRIWIEEIASKLGLNYDFIEKYRDRYTGKITQKFKEVKGNNVLIFDDIIASGKTMKNLIDYLEKLNKNVYCIAVHGIFINSLNYFKNKKCFVSNTILSPLSRIDVSGDIIKVLEEI